MAKECAGGKKAKSGYMIFSKEVRETIKTEHPEFKSKEIMKEIGKRWSELSDEKKEEYKKKVEKCE